MLLFNLEQTFRVLDPYVVFVLIPVRRSQKYEPHQKFLLLNIFGFFHYLLWHNPKNDDLLTKLILILVFSFLLYMIFNLPSADSVLSNLSSKKNTAKVETTSCFKFLFSAQQPAAKMDGDIGSRCEKKPQDDVCLNPIFCCFCSLAHGVFRLFGVFLLIYWFFALRPLRFSIFSVACVII